MHRERFVIMPASGNLHFLKVFTMMRMTVHFHANTHINKRLDLNWDGKMLNGAMTFSVTAYKLAFAVFIVYLSISLLFLAFINETNCRGNND
jgi:hypothetical protein